MGNQQEIDLKETDLAWLAGMLNGDGCFSLNMRRKESGHVACDISFTLTQTDAAIIEHAFMLLEIITGGTPYITEQDPRSNGVRPVMHLRLGKMTHISRLLPAIIPYMIGQKKAKAILLQKYIARRMLYEGKSRKSFHVADDPESIDIAKEFYRVSQKEMPRDVVEILRG